MCFLLINPFFTNIIFIVTTLHSPIGLRLDVAHPTQTRQYLFPLCYIVLEYHSGCVVSPSVLPTPASLLFKSVSHVCTSFGCLIGPEGGNSRERWKGPRGWDVAELKAVGIHECYVYGGQMGLQYSGDM
jgi:hypothetical protein